MLGIVLIVASGFFYDFWRSQQRPRIYTNYQYAINHARQLGMALFEFESEYGGFPSESTAATVKTHTGSTWKLGDATSNDLFRQLFAAGIVTNEEMFYVPAAGTHRPDNHFATEADALSQGECGFAYISNQSVAGNSSRPIVLAPVIPGTTKFDPRVFNGTAIILRLDNSVQAGRIDADGHIVGEGGKDFLDPSQPIWGGVAPVVKWPDLDPTARSTRSSSPGFLTTLTNEHPGALSTVLAALVMWWIGRSRLKVRES